MVLHKHGFTDEWLEDHTPPPLPTGFRSNGKAVGRFLFGLPWWLSGRESACMQETQVPSLSQEDPLEEDMAAHSSYSCLEDPTDRGAWWATVHGVAQSRTWLSDWIAPDCLFPVSFCWHVWLQASALSSILSSFLLKIGIVYFPSCMSVVTLLST